LGHCFDSSGCRACRLWCGRRTDSAGNSDRDIPIFRCLFQTTQSQVFDEHLLILPEEDLWKALEDEEVQAVFLLEDDIPEGQWVAAVGWTALTFAVNPENPVRDLSREAIRDAYEGRITNWRELGGADQTVAKYAFLEGSELFRVFERIVLSGGRLAPDVFSAPGAWAMTDAANDDPAALVYMLCSDDRMGTRDLTVDGIAPQFASVKNGSYPFRIPVLLTARQPVPEPILQLAAWAQSEMGQAVFEHVCTTGDE
jgi:phosphate transport system substrate-binding protein